MGNGLAKRRGRRKDRVHMHRIEITGNRRVGVDHFLGDRDLRSTLGRRHISHLGPHGMIAVNLTWQTWSCR